MKERVMERDLRILRWAGEQYAARLDHVRVLMGVTTMPSIYNMMKRLRKAGLAQTQRVLEGQPLWVVPTKLGLEVCELPYRAWSLRLGSVMHVGAICDVRVHIEERSPGMEWVSERRLMLQMRAKGRAVPDGVAIVAGRRAAIEVELSHRTDGSLRRVLDERSRCYDGVVYYCAPETYRQLTRVRESEPARWPTLAIRELPPPPPPAKEYR
jgi:hypothetical protein